MARAKAPFPSVPHLVALIRLYGEIKGLNYENRFTKDYADLLNGCLADDGVLSGVSKSLSSKMRGFPSPPNIDQCDEGIDIDRLDLVSQIVLEHYKDKLPVEKASASSWADFQKTVFQVPEYFKYVQEFKYFKYLSQADQQAINAFVERMLNQLDLRINDVCSYCLYFQSREYITTFKTILQIDKKNKVATYTQYAKTGDQWVLRSALTTDRPDGAWQLRNNSLWIDLVEEDRERKQIRMTLTLAALDSDLFYTEFVKGMLQSSAENSTVPMDVTCVIQRMASYREAYEVVTNKKSYDQSINIAVLNGRAEVNERKLTSKEKFHTAKIATLVEQISGAFLFGYLQKPHGFKAISSMFSRGICFIEKDGIMKWQIKGKPPVIGRVLTDVVHGHDIITFADFYFDGKDEFKYHYYLKVYVDDLGTRLEGTYTGMDDGLPRTGAIAFIKKDEYNSFEDISKEKKYCDKVPLKSLTSEDDLRIREVLLNNPYIILPDKTWLGNENV